jgi:hypothetical protein
VADELDALRERAAAPAPALPRGLSAGAAEQVRLILEAAERSATELRDQAARDAGDHVARVEIAADRMMSRLDGLQRELDGLLEALKRSGSMLEDGLDKLRTDAAAVGEPPLPAPPEPDAVPEPPVVAANGHAELPADEAGARLIALNMALSGTPREETARFLAEHYALPDPEALLDDVYSRADPPSAP